MYVYHLCAEDGRSRRVQGADACSFSARGSRTCNTSHLYYMSKARLKTYEPCEIRTLSAQSASDLARKWTEIVNAVETVFLWSYATRRQDRNRAPSSGRNANDKHNNYPQPRCQILRQATFVTACSCMTVLKPTVKTTPRGKHLPKLWEQSRSFAERGPGVATSRLALCSI